MGQVTTYTAGGVVTHRSDDRPSVDVVQLPQRDAAAQATAPETPAATTPAPVPAKPAAATPAAPVTTPAPAVKAATKQKAARVKKGKKR